MEPDRAQFGQMPGINDNALAPSFRDLSIEDASPRAWVWSSVGVGVLVLGAAVYFLGDWLDWF